MSPDDKAPPKGALEEAVSLYDELHAYAAALRNEAASGVYGGALTIAMGRVVDLADLERRRAALEPRLAKRRDNQAKGRGSKP